MVAPQIQILDAAMGTELIKHGLDLPLPLWSADCNLTHPEVVLKIHQDNITAGANYITTNTFRTTLRAFHQSGLSKSESDKRFKQALNAAVKLAKKATSDNVKVIGSIAPLEDCYSPKLFHLVPKILEKLLNFTIS